MEKVKLPREVAEAIENTKFMGQHSVINAVVTLKFHETSTTEIVIIHDHFKSNWTAFADVILNGYEVEQTPEDRVREFYTHNRDNLVNPNGYYGNEVRCETVINVLNLLEIKIEGVNA